MWCLKICNPNQYTNVIGGATRLSVSIIVNYISGIKQRKWCEKPLLPPQETKIFEKASV